MAKGQEDQTSSSDLLVLILFFSAVIGVIVIAILYTNFMSIFIKNVIILDYNLAILMNKIFEIFNKGQLDYIEVLLENPDIVKLKFSAMGGGYYFERTRDNGFELFSSVMEYFRPLHYFYLFIIFVFSYLSMFGKLSPLKALENLFNPAKDKEKLVKEAKERVKIKNNWYKVYPNDKILQNLSRKVVNGDFLTLDYYPPYLDIKKHGSIELSLKDFIITSLKYSNSNLNLNQDYYLSVLEVLIDFENKIIKSKDYFALYYYYYIMTLKEEEFIERTTPIIETKNNISTIVLEGENVADFYIILKKYLPKKYILTIDKSKNKLLNIYAINIENTEKKGQIVPLSLLHTVFQIKTFKNKETYLNKANKNVDSIEELHYREKWDIISLLNFLYDKKIIYTDEHSKYRNYINKNKSNKEELNKIVSILKGKLETFLIKGIEDIKIKNIDGGSTKISYNRPIIPKMYILNPVPKGDNILEQIKNFKCLGIEYLRPILEDLLIKPENKFEKQKKDIFKEIEFIKNRTYDTESIKEEVETLEAIVAELERSKSDTSDLESRASRLKEIFSTHMFEETLIIGLWSFSMELENLPTGRLSKVKYKNNTLWYALTSLGRPYRYINGVPIYLLYEMERKIYLEQKPLKEKALNDAPIDELKKIKENVHENII